MPEKRMTFKEHLEELRKCIIIIALSVLIFFILALCFQDYIVDFMCLPHRTAIKMLSGEYPNIKAEFISFKYSAPLISYLKIDLLVALILASPVIAYQIWSFIAAGLYIRERGFILMFAPASFILFALGCAFGFVYLVPISLYFLAKYANPQIVNLAYSISDYLSLVTILTLVIAVIFQLPLVMLFLSKIGITSAKTFSGIRKYAIVGIFIFAAIITPPDPVSQIVTAIPMLFLYELGIILTRIFCRQRAVAS